VVGLDHSRVMRGQALARNREAARAGGVLLRTGSVEDAAALGLTFDKAFSCNVAQFWPDPDGALAAIKSVLRTGGVLATTFQPAGRGAKASDADRFAEICAERLQKAGFTDLRVERLADLRPTPAVCLLATA
jgi:SAM-dependent methyltransferase